MRAARAARAVSPARVLCPARVMCVALMMCVVLPAVQTRAAANPNPAAVGESWGDAWVNVTFTPAKSRAHEPVTIDIDVIAGTPSHPVDAGVVTPTLEREAAFSHMIGLPVPATLLPDPHRPGHYALSFVPPHSGLYRLSLEAPALHAARPARIEFPVWPQGVNRYVLVPLMVMMALIAACIAWIRRQQRATRGNPPRGR